MLIIFGSQYLKLQWDINICLLCVILRYTYWGLKATILFWCTTNTSFYYVALLIITKLCLFYWFIFNYFVILCNTSIYCSQVHLQPPNSVNFWHKANIKIQTLSGVGQFLWGRSWPWFRSSGFRNLGQYNTVTKQC